MQFSTALSSSNVTNPNPLGLPVSLSIIKVASRTVPNCSKYSLNSSSITSCPIPPTNILEVRSCSSRGIARFGSIYDYYGRMPEIFTILPSRICSLTMTTLTHLGSLKVRNPNPRDRPVWFSRMTVHSVISPNCSKYARKDSIMLSAAIRRHNGTICSFPI